MSPPLARCCTLGSLGCDRIGGVGYCFGGRYVARYLRPGKIDVGFAAHPTMMGAEELSAVAGPFSIAAAVDDVVYTAEKRRESEDVLAKLSRPVPYQVNLFSHCGHGFSVRCDMTVKEQKIAKEAAFLQAVHWFDMYLKE